MVNVAESIRTELSRMQRATPELLDQIEFALAAYPNDAEMWLLRGDAMQLSDDERTNALVEAERSYRRAAELKPNSARAYESLGRFWSEVMDDPVTALRFFERAVALGAGASARHGLHGVQSELRDRSRLGAV